MLCALKDVAAAFKGRPFKMICQEDWFVKQEQHNNRDGSNDSNSSHLRDHFLCAKYRILYALYQLSLTISLRGRFYCYPPFTNGKLCSGMIEKLTETQIFFTPYPVLSTTVILSSCCLRVPDWLTIWIWSLVHQFLSESMSFFFEAITLQRIILYTVFNYIPINMRF